MSTSVIPDMYRHTARKSTVSKSMKSTNGSSSPANSSASSRSFLVNHHDDKLLKVSSPMKTPPISYQIKMEKDIATERFLILPDNETEQMIVDDDDDNDVERVVQQILEQILEQIPSTVSTTTTDKRMNTNDQIPLKNSQVEIDEIHQVLHSMLNTFHENDRQTISTDSNKVLPMPMDEDEPSILSSTQSHIDDDEEDDDIEEIPPSSNHEPEKADGSCTCQCHSPSSPLNNEYQLFEQALRKTRLECEQEKSMQNNHLIQTLKRQHEELMSFVQQNKRFSRPTPIARVDREQQTSKLTCQDFQIQTDIVTSNTNGIIPPVKSSTPSNPPTAATSSSSSTSNGPLTATRISTSSSTIARPRLSTNSKSNGTASPLPPTQVSPTNNRKPTVVPPPPPPPPPAQPARTAHDVVDLTEEDEEEDTSRVPIQRAAPPRVAPVATAAAAVVAVAAPVTQPSTTTTPAAAAAPVAARTRPSTTSRPSRPNDPLPSAAAQTFPLRPLPEHTPCDHSIARPQLSITQENGTVRLTWNLPLTPMEAIQNYEIYAYKQNAAVTTSDWKKIGTVKSMRLPMAVTLKEFQSNSHYAFAVRAVSTANQIGPFCEPKTIFTGNTPVQPLHTSQLLNVSS